MQLVRWGKGMARLILSPGTDGGERCQWSRGRLGPPDGAKRSWRGSRLSPAGKRCQANSGASRRRAAAFFRPTRGRGGLIVLADGLPLTTMFCIPWRWPSRERCQSSRGKPSPSLWGNGGWHGSSCLRHPSPRPIGPVRWRNRGEMGESRLAPLLLGPEIAHLDTPPPSGVHLRPRASDFGLTTAAGIAYPATKGKAGGKLPRGKVTVRSPFRSFSAASRKAATNHP